MSDNFKSAKELYTRGLSLPKTRDYTEDQNIKFDNNSKYARAARLGLCFKCFREDENPDHRPRHLLFAFCPECYSDMKLGVERLEAKNWLEVNKWFK